MLKFGRRMVGEGVRFFSVFTAVMVVHQKYIEISCTYIYMR